MAKSFFVLIVSFFIISCDTEIKKNELSFDTNKLRAEEQKYIQKMEKAKNKVLDFSKNFTPEELKAFLPTQINGFEKLPNSIGTQSNEDGSLFSFAKAQFQNDKRQNIVIDIFDYGKDGNVPNKSNYSKPPQDLDVPSKKYKDEFSFGFINIDKNLDYGRLEVLVQDRFVVVVRINKFIENEKQLIDILKLVKLEKLINK